MILEILKQEIPFIIALVLGVIGHTLAGAIKHYNDFNWKELIVGAIKFASILAVIVMVVVGINLYEPLIERFADELKTLQEVIVIGVYAKTFLLIKDYFDIKDEEDMGE